MKKILATAFVSASLVLAGGGAATAAAPSESAPKSLCSGSRTVFKSTKSAAPFVQASGKNSSVTGGPGVTLAISTSTSYSVSGSITSTTGITAGNVIASVKADVGVTIGTSKTGTTTNSGSWKVPGNYKTGRLAIGALKYSGTTSRYLENSGCKLVFQNATSFNAPQNEWHFQTSKVA